MLQVLRRVNCSEVFLQHFENGFSFSTNVALIFSLSIEMLFEFVILQVMLEVERFATKGANERFRFPAIIEMRNFH